jgi:hypothetical protein
MKLTGNIHVMGKFHPDDQAISRVLLSTILSRGCGWHGHGARAATASSIAA